MKKGRLLLDIDINAIHMNLGTVWDWKWLPCFVNEPFGGKNFYQCDWLCFYWSWRVGNSGQVENDK